MKLGFKEKFIILSICSAVLMVSVFFYTFGYVKDLLSEKEKESAENVLSVVNDEINTLLSGYESDVRLISNLNSLHDLYYVKTNNADEEKLSNDLEGAEQVFLSFMREREEYYQLSYVDNQGQEIVKIDRDNKNSPARVVAQNELQNKSDRDYFINTMALSPGKVFVSEMNLNIKNGKIEVPFQPVIRFSMPVFDSNNRNQGVVTINIFTDTIIDVLKDIPYKRNYLIDQDGYFLFNPDEVEKEWSRDLGTNFVYEDFANRKNLFSSIFRSNDFVAIKPVISAKDNFHFYYKISYAPNNVERYWVIVSEMNLNDFFSGYFNLKDKVFFINLVIVLLILIIFSSFVIYFTRPIKHLKQAVDYLNMGRYDLELPIFSKDEFGEFTKKLNFLTKKIRDNEDEKYEFIKSASHQLRTPASSMRFQLDLLKEGFKDKKGGDKVIKSLTDIETELNRTNNIINDLLKYVKVGDNYFASNLVRINVLEMIEEVVATLDEEIYRKKLNLKIKIPESLKIEADELRMKDVFVYLISNAVQYSNDNGEVVIYAEKRENEVYFEIRDTGIGIPKKEQLRMFEKFFRASNAYSKKGVGSGLGLVISRNIIKGHGGKLEFKSRENKGSKFYFSIFGNKR